jgi:predicted RNA polymerase sigma factor
VTLLLDHPIAGSPATYGLSALMLLLAARLPSRIDSTGNLMSLEHQDRTNWDADLIAKGHEHLEKSAVGSALTEYHIEAAIAAIHCATPRFEETQWGCHRRTV